MEEIQSPKYNLEMCQLIYYDFTINQEVGKYFENTHFVDVGTNYNTTAIIGPQSTGKSTLLNLLFDTNFAVMNSSNGRGQTTKGVWVAGHKEQRVMIIDCEGTDSKNRKEDERGKFEHSSSLFALSLSDVLIINMWTNDVGRYTASNYGVLKIVFEMNLKLFQQECAKKILIILRDFDPKRNQKEKIESMILADILKIWGEIKKPEKYKDSQPQTFFNFEFIALSHKIYLPKVFEEEVFELRKRLDSSHPNYLFKHLNNIKSVPVDGLKQYVSQIWDDIQNEKELDIPSQKEMLATYRCSEIKANTLIEFESNFKELNTRSAKNHIDNFKVVGEQLLEKIMAVYYKTASNYDDNIYKAIGKQLEDAVMQKLLMCFINQSKILIPIVQRFLRHDLQKISKEENFSIASKGLRNKYIKILLLRLKEKQVFNKWLVNEQEYEHIFEEIIENQKRIALAEEKQKAVKMLKKQLDDALTTCLETNTKDFWENFNDKYILIFFMKIYPLRVFLRDFYSITDEELTEIVQSIETEVYDSIKKNCTEKIKNVSDLIIELFKNKFWNENNAMRNWNKYQDEEIDELFKKYRIKYLELLKQLKIFKVNSHPLLLIAFRETEKFEEEIVIPKSRDALKKLTDCWMLMKQNEVLAFKKKIDAGLSNILEEAKKRKEGFFVGNIPLWFYGVLIAFGYDDIWRLMKSFYFIPVLLFGSTFVIVYKYDSQHIMKNLYFDIEAKLLKIKKKISTFLKIKLKY